MWKRMRIAMCDDEMAQRVSFTKATDKWKISIRQVQNYCKNGWIEGVQMIENAYVIPATVKKPIYTRTHRQI